MINLNHFFKIGLLGACMIPMQSIALEVLSPEEQKKQGLFIDWLVKPPKTVKSGESFKVGWKLTGGKVVNHFNLHVCPMALGTNCAKKDRQDGSVLTGMGNQDYEQEFNFKPGTVSGQYYAVGHAQVDEVNVLSEPEIIEFIAAP